MRIPLSSEAAQKYFNKFKSGNTIIPEPQPDYNVESQTEEEKETVLKEVEDITDFIMSISSSKPGVKTTNSSKLTDEEWRTLRAERELGATLEFLSKKWDVSISSINYHAKKEGWADSSKGKKEVKDLVMTRLRKIEDEKVEEIKKGMRDESANLLMAVVERHRSEPDLLRVSLRKAVQKHDLAQDEREKRIAYEDIKAVKLASDAMMNIHKMERKAWCLDSNSNDDNDDNIVEIVNPRDW